MKNYLSDFLFILFALYMTVCAVHNMVVGPSIKSIWENIKTEGFKVKHLLNLIIFLPSWLIIFLIFIPFFIGYLISRTKLGNKLNHLLNKTIWKGDNDNVA
jgi:ABC-type uncharacterized transport system permease subunit